MFKNKDENEFRVFISKCKPEDKKKHNSFEELKENTVNLETPAKIFCKNRGKMYTFSDQS